jgi:hypothetical protein
MSEGRKRKVCFMTEEDQIIRDFVSKHGISSWSKIVKVLPNRTAKQCKERWKNVLDPNLSKSEWTNKKIQRFFIWLVYMVKNGLNL